MLKVNKETEVRDVKPQISEEELELINKYTKKRLTGDEVYVFSVTLCDNEVDRDFEVFSLETMEGLRELFVGKTGIMDHENRASNQLARIYKTELELLEGSNLINERKARLKAKAYIPVTEFTKEIISRIEGGILKEVSIGCSVKRSVCNICSKEHCSHIKGKYYGGVQCVKILEGALDAYEFSFVAVPAQRNAGVNKGFTLKEEFTLTEKIKNLREGESLTLLYQEALDLHKKALWGEEYRNSLVEEIRKASEILEPGLKSEIVNEMAMALDINKLTLLNKYYKDKLNKRLPITTQLAENISKETEENANCGFRI